VRIIVQVFKKAWAFEMNFTRAEIRSPDDLCDEEEDEFERVPMDPHSTVMAHLERRTDMEDSFGAVGKRRFGFHGSGN
jgi:hypothetical protein